jgi:molybdopterin synthase catalytic subunit/molybdopterin/thiamine biosynthesis adenylyltransferase
VPLFFAHSEDELMMLSSTPIHPKDGGHVVFSGTVRNFNKQKSVSYLFYEAYETLAIKQFAGLERQAKERFGISSAVAVHRLGRTGVSESAVIIKACAPHRHEAFLAARFLIDELKKTVAIWKQEYYEDGTSSWDDGLCACNSDKALEPVKKAFLNLGQNGEALKNSRVLLVGAGGLGCPIALNLGALGIGHLSIIDGDVVSEGNLARQFAYTRDNIGEFKVSVLENFLKSRFSWLTMRTYAEYLSLVLGREVIQDYNLIIDSSDCMRTKIMLAKLCYEYKINFICASVFSDEGEVAVVRAKNQGCFCCFRKISKQPDTCVSSGVFTHICTLVGAYACAQAKDLLLQMHEGEANSITLLSIHEGFRKLKLAPDPQCFVCQTSVRKSVLTSINKTNLGVS